MGGWIYVDGWLERWIGGWMESCKANETLGHYGLGRVHIHEVEDCDNLVFIYRILFSFWIKMYGWIYGCRWMVRELDRQVDARQ